MKAVFGVVSLLVALTVVGVLVKRQMQAIGGVAGSSSAAAASDGGTAVLSSPRQAQALQDKVRDDTAHALQQGADRTRAAAD